MRVQAACRSFTNRIRPRHLRSWSQCLLYFCPRLRNTIHPPSSRISLDSRRIPEFRRTYADRNPRRTHELCVLSL